MHRLEVIRVIKSSVIFEGISKKSLEAVCSSMRTVSVAKKSPIFVPRERPGPIHVLLSGRVKVVRLSSRGRELILELIEPGEIFGEMSIMGEEPQDVVAEAMENSCIGMLPRSKLDELLQHEPDLGMRIARLIAQRRRDMEKRVESLVFQRVPGRLAHLLLQLSGVYGTPDSRGTLLRIRLSQQDLGNFIGASREIVSLTLSDFRRRGFIDVRKRRLIIRQPQPLAQLQ